MHGKTELFDQGFTILKAAVDVSTVRQMRKQVIDNYHLMANTRPNPASRHIAGFERFAPLAPLHQTLASNPVLNQALAQIYGDAEFATIGLSDITVNRSQPWHTDLLRGKYAEYLTPQLCWGGQGAGCLKALLYLQDGKSLKIVPGSHRRPVSLADDSGAVPQDPETVFQVPVSVGDIIVMDIRVMHRGSTEDEMRETDLLDAPKILISTVFGETEAALTQAMQAGNAHRMRDWEQMHLAKAAV